MTLWLCRYLAEQTERNLRELQEQMTLKTAKLQTSSQKAEELLKESGSLKEEMEKLRNQLSDSRAAIATLDRDKDAMQVLSLSICPRFFFSSSHNYDRFI